MKTVDVLSARAYGFHLECLMHDENKCIQHDRDLTADYKDGYADCLEEFRTIWDGDLNSEFDVSFADAFINDAKGL